MSERTRPEIEAEIEWFLCEICKSLASHKTANHPWPSRSKADGSADDNDEPTQPADEETLLLIDYVGMSNKKAEAALRRLRSKLRRFDREHLGGDFEHEGD